MSDYLMAVAVFMPIICGALIPLLLGLWVFRKTQDQFILYL